MILSGETLHLLHEMFASIERSSELIVKKLSMHDDEIEILKKEIEILKLENIKLQDRLDVSEKLNHIHHGVLK